MKDNYKVLEVLPNASPSEIKEQYNFLIQAWHPDKFRKLSDKMKAEEIAKQLYGRRSLAPEPSMTPYSISRSELSSKTAFCPGVLPGQIFFAAPVKSTAPSRSNSSNDIVIAIPIWGWRR